MAPSRSYGRVSITTLFETMRRPFCAELQVSINRVNCVPCQISYIRGGPGQWDHGTVGSRWRPSPVPALVHAGCGCCGCGHVGDARASSKRSGMSTAVVPTPLPDAHRHSVAERLVKAQLVVEG